MATPQQQQLVVDGWRAGQTARDTAHELGIPLSIVKESRIGAVRSGAINPVAEDLVEPEIWLVAAMTVKQWPQFNIAVATVNPFDETGGALTDQQAIREVDHLQEAAQTYGILPPNWAEGRPPYDPEIRPLLQSEVGLYETGGMVNTYLSQGRLNEALQLIGVHKDELVFTGPDRDPIDYLNLWDDHINFPERSNMQPISRLVADAVSDYQAGNWPDRPGPNLPSKQPDIVPMSKSQRHRSGRGRIRY